MKEHLIQVVHQSAINDVGARKNLAREYLQHYLLRLLAELRVTAELDFLGGTALRLLYQLPRFSEDLDFSLADAENASAFDARDLFVRLKSKLTAANYEVYVKAKTQKNVAAAFFRFAHIAAECGLTQDPRAVLSVKIEIDIHPPAGAHSDTTLVNRFLPFAVRHHDLPSLFAGKLHALLSRNWAKGRDWFDLVWYLTVHQGLVPNEILLKNALAQTGNNANLARSWRQALKKLFVALDWKQVVDDMKPFVERQSDLEQLSADNIRALLEFPGKGR
jgi:predicted nucleotidyltransferase component of viral defense system